MTNQAILIVEDEGILALHTKTILEKNGYEVFEPVASGEKAIEFLKTNQPTLILMDIELSGKLNGIETAKLISEKQETPIIFVTGFSQDHLIKQAKTTAPYGYLVKPIEERELIATIEMALYKHQLDLKLKQSEYRYRSLVEQASDGIMLIDSYGMVIEANPVACKIFDFSYSEIVGKPFDKLLLNERKQTFQFFDRLKKGKIVRIEGYVNYDGGNYLPVEVHGNILADGGVQILVRDITVQKEKENFRAQTERRLKILVKIAQYETQDVQEFLDYALDEAIELTSSEIGYIYFYDEHQEKFTLNSWSKNVMKKCEILEPQTEYVLALTGLWGEAVRQRKPIIDNDFFSPGELKKGYPEGHIKLKKFMTIPVMIKDQIMAVVGVANKKSDYIESDVLQLSLLMDSVWKKVLQIETENSLLESKKNFNAFFQSIDEMIVVTNLKGQILFNNEIVTKNLGYSTQELRSMHALDLHGIKKREIANLIYDELLNGKRTISTLPLISKEGYEIPAETRIWTGTWDDKDCIYVLSKNLSAEKEAFERFERLFRNNPALMAVSSLNDRKFVDVNDNFEIVTGYSRHEAIGKTALELNLFPDYEKHKLVGEKLHQQGSISNQELQIRCKDGKILEGNFSGEIIFIQGAPYSLTVMIDITETKRYQNALEQKREENEFLAHAAQTLTTCKTVDDVNQFICYSIKRIAPDMPVVFANINHHSRLKIIDILGLEKNFIMTVLNKLGYDFRKKTYPLDDKFRNYYQRQSLTNYTEGVKDFLTEEMPNQLADFIINSLKIEDVTIIGIADQKENYGVLQFFKTEHSKEINRTLVESFVHQCYLAFARIDSFEKLKSSEQKISQLVNNIDETIWLRDKFTKELLFVNSARKKLLMGSEKDWLADVSAFIDVIHEEDRERIKNAEEKLFKENIPFDEEYRVSNKDGKPQWLRVRKYPVYAENNTISRYAGIAEDITDKKNLQTAMNQSEEKYHLLFTEMEEGFALHEIILNDDGKPIDYRFLDVNPKFEFFTGLQAKDCIGKTVMEIFPDTEMYWIERYGDVALSGEPLHYENYSQALHRWFSVNAFCPTKGQFAVTITDISDTKNAEQLLQSALDQNQAMLHAMPDIMFLFDHECVIKNFHAVDKNMLYEKPEIFMGKKIDVFLPPELVELTHTKVATALQQRETQYARYELPINGRVNHFEARYAVSGNDEVLAIVRDITKQHEAEAQVVRTTEELRTAYEETLQGWSNALELREHETAGHSQRVVDLSIQLAKKMGIKEQDLVHFRRGALLHDIGKMGIPDSILLKPGPLTDDEWVIMRQHPVYAYKLLTKIPFLKPALEIPYCHHEKWDGTGYPRKLRGLEIPLSARIFAVIDVWDALSNNRPYRPAWGRDAIRDYLIQQKDKHFDPQVVEAFLEMLNDQGN